MYNPSSFNNIWNTNQERNPENNLNLCNDNLYAVFYPTFKSFKNSPAYSIPKAWNKLSTNVRGQHYKITFSIALETHLLNLFKRSLISSSSVSRKLPQPSPVFCRTTSCPLVHANLRSPGLPPGCVAFALLPFRPSH